MIVKHITSVSNALSILETRQYIPYSIPGTKDDVWLCEDFCLNLLPLEDGRIYSSVETGAVIYFEWLGEVVVLTSQTPPFHANVLYIDKRNCETPWRYFIKPFNNPELLRIADIKFNEESLNDVIQDTKISVLDKIKLLLTKGNYQDNCYKLKQQNFKDNLMNKLKENPAISIIDPWFESRIGYDNK